MKTKKSPMHIAIFTNNYLPNPYGVSGSIESFRKQFEKLGHKVFIFAPNYKNYKDENPNVFRYPALDIKYKIKFPIVIPYSLKIDKIIEDLPIDIIHSQHPNLLGSVAKKWARKKKVPLVFTWHTLYDQYAHFVPLIPKKLSSSYIIKKAVNYADSCDFVVTPTNSVREMIRKWGVQNENIEPVATGIEEAFYQNPDETVIRDKFHVKKEEKLLLLVSRLTQEKNIEFLFNSIFRVLKNKDNVKFIVVGEGCLVSKLKKMVAYNNLKGRVIFAGIVSKKELKNYYVAGDVFVYSSKSETQGMIISEAMYMGLPIVAVDAPGVCDLVQDEINGFLVSEDEKEFAMAVEKLIADENQRNKFSTESKRIAQENFTDKVCSDKMLEIYKSLISSKLRLFTEEGREK